MKDDQPKQTKRGRPRKTSNKSLSSVDGNVFEFSQNEKAEAEEVIRQAAKILLGNLMYDKSKSDIDTLIALVSEYLDSFIIMGYDFENNAISPIFYANDEKSADALSNHLQKVFVSSLKPPS